MIYQEKPSLFNSKFEIVSCFVEHNGKILLLHRQNHKPEGDTWGVPAGKLDSEESITKAIIREIQEETGLIIPLNQIVYFKKVYVKYPSYDFVYHIFHTKLDNQQKIIINHNEHKDFNWISPKEALKIPLIQDLDACIKLFYKTC
ncbi:MAG: NUDIX hydrolase [archaeon]